MPDASLAVRHHLVLYRRDPGQGRARFFSLMIERGLFGTIRLAAKRPHRGVIADLRLRAAGALAEEIG
jgi:hypothetical protein